MFRIREHIRDAIVALRPDVVILELDQARFQSLMARSRGTAQQLGGSFVQKRMARFQEEIAGLYGAEVGEEMLAGAEGARIVGAKVALVDDAVDGVLRNAMRQLTWREKFRGAGMLLGGLAKSVFPVTRRKAKAKVEAELKAYQEDPESMLSELQRNFPTLHRLLIEERNQRMAARMRSLLATHPRAVAVVGDGHVGGLVALLSDLQPTTYRLADVRAGRLPRAPTATGTTESVGFSFQATGQTW